MGDERVEKLKEYKIGYSVGRECRYLASGGIGSQEGEIRGKGSQL